MTVTHLRQSIWLSGQGARRFTARRFSTKSALQKEIQDAYILSASRTPTAKVRPFLPPMPLMNGN